MELVSSYPVTEATWIAPQPPHRRRAHRVTVLGSGSAVPPRVVDNAYFVEQLGLDTTATWIEQRTGIRQRRHVESGVHVSELAAQAARQALDRAGLAAERIDLIIVATSTPDYVMPSTACLVQQRLGAGLATAFDLSNACAGFAYALDVAARYLATEFEHALVIGADLGSRLVNFADRSTCIFFGDGAGAVVLGGSGGGRILATRLCSSGDPESLLVPIGGVMTMDGRAIWNFATRVLPDTVRHLCRDAEVTVEQIKLLVPHQANRNILLAAADELGIPHDRLAVNIDRYGNTLAASIPIAFDEALVQGRLRSGDLVALVGFGAGLAWGGVLLEL
jgi:3-oxoacyl-[acyl-carrier-protein] synthase III